jgi:nucleotide-binding universal stress UspA family protein
MAAIPDWQQPYRHLRPQKLVPVDTLVLPLDGSSAAKAALPVARRMARLYCATLQIVYVGEQLQGPRQTLQELGIAPEELRGALLDQLSGDPAKAILETLRRCHAPLLVMATHTGNHHEEALLGSVAELLLNCHLDRVLLVAPERGERDWHIHRVLLAHDGSPRSEVATAEAADVALRAGAEVLAMHVAAPRSPDELAPGSIPAPRYLDQPQHEWPAWANEFLDRMMALGASPVKVRFKLMVTGGQPGSEIADFARENQADLVVAAWHGGWDAEQSGALKVIVRRCNTPVLLVYAQEAQH